MKIILHLRYILLLTALILLSACDVLVTPLPNTPVPGLIQTYAAQTLSADVLVADLRQSQTPASTETSSPTHTVPPTFSGLPTATAFPTVPTELFNSSQAITSTATLDPAFYPTPDYTRKLEDGSPAPCNAAKFIADIAVPDGFRVKVGEKFTKIWRIQNVGACTWTPEYALVLTWGNDFGIAPPVWFDQITKPGELYDIIMVMEAPYLPACWQGNWIIQDPEGLRFGVGNNFTISLRVMVSVYLSGFGFLQDPCKDDN